MKIDQYDKDMFFLEYEPDTNCYILMLKNIDVYEEYKKSD